MRHFYLGVLLLVISFQNSIAQQITFRTSYDIAALDIAGGITQNPSSRNYLMAGTNTSFIPLYGNVTQLDTAGNIMWSKGYSAGSIATDIWDIKNVSTGGYIVTGSTGSGLMLIRLDVNGNVTWSNRYHVTSGTDEHGQRLIETSDGGFVVAGYVYSATPPAGTRQDSANCYCLKVNSAGTLQWAKTFFVSTTFINDHVLNDVAEVSDGYIFVGYTSVDGNDNDGTYALALKTDVNGNLQWMKRWGSTSAEANAVTALSSSQVMVTGDDNNKTYFLKVNAAGTTVSSSQYTFPGLLSVAVPYNGYVTNDGNYAFDGMYLSPLAFTFATYVMKVNSSTGAVIFGRTFNSGLSSILPEGIQALDSGYISVMTAQQMTGFNYHVVKTDKNGFMNNVNCDTIAITTPSRSTYNPTTTAITPVELTTVTANSFTPVVATLNPSQVVECLVIPCTPPSAPTASASPSGICAGQSSTISASGSGGGVTYNVYANSTGGTSLGTTPLSVSPGSTTTYYVEASSSAGCVSSSRTPVTVTVTPVPGAVGSISGSTSACTGAQAYSIGAVTNATSYTWSVSGGGSVTSGQNSTNVTVTWTTAGTYNVSVTASNSCGNSTASISVNVVAPPTSATAVAVPNPVCANINDTLRATAANATTWQWSGPNGYSVNAQNPIINSIQPNQAGTYTVTASNTCGTVTASVNVVVNSAPTNVSASSNPVSPVCQNQQVSLSASATGALSYSWSGPNSYTSNQQNPSLGNIQTSGAGTYIVSATNSCGSTTASVTLVVNTAPTNVTASAAPNPVCLTLSASLNGGATGATSYSWSGPAGFSASTQNTTVNNFQQQNAGVYTLSAVNTCGTSTATVTVNADSVPSNVVAGSNTTSTCFGSTIDLTGTASGATSYSWTGPNGFASNQQNPIINNATVADSGTYFLTATNGCGNSVASIVVNVDTTIDNLSATSSPNDTLCTGSNINLHASGSNVNSWSWSGPSFTSTLPDPVIANATPANSGQYILTATNACGSANDTLTILVEAGNLTLTASSSLQQDSGCYGSNITLSATGSVFTSYQWNGPNGFSSAQQNPVINNATIAQSGTYTVSATNSCGSRTASVTIQIDTLIQNLTVNSSPNDTVCAGTSVTLNASGDNVHNWSWAGPAGFSSSVQNPVINNSTISNSGAYILTASNTCGNVKDTITLIVENGNQTLTASSSAANDSGCYGQNIQLSASSSFDSYSWTGPSGFSSNLQNPTFNNATVAQSGLYIVTANYACGTSSDSLVLVIDTIPQGLSVSTTGNNNATCQGQSITVTAGSSGPVSWSWTGPNGFASSQASFTLQNAQPNQQGAYIVTATNSCGSKRDTVFVTVYTLPTNLRVTASSDSICPGQSVTLSVSGGVTGATWSNGQSGNSIVVTQAGVYFYSAHDSNSCVVNSDTASIIQSLPPVLDLFASNAATVCQGQAPLVLHATSDAQATVVWLPGNFTGDSLSVVTPGTYLATATKNGCSASDTITVQWATLPTISFIDTALSTCCLNATVSPDATGSGLSYTWSDGNTGASDNLTQSGVYTVTITNNQGCTATAYVNFNKVCIDATATSNPDSIQVEEQSQLNATTTLQNNIVYSWSPVDSLTNPNISNPVAQPKHSTDYTVIITDTISGCSDTAIVHVGVKWDADYGVPNVFSPNGDNMNDTWGIINQGGFVTVEEVRIFDRWGETVFDSQRDGAIEWNGKYHGKLQPMGNYVYNVKLKINATGVEKFLKGNLSLIL